MVRRMASVNVTDPADALPEKDSALIEECVTFIANKGLTNDINMPNFLMCVSISLLVTVAINEGMDAKDIKKLVKRVKKEMLSSAKQFYDGDVTDLGIMEDPQPDGPVG